LELLGRATTEAMVFREEPVVMALRVAGWLEVAVVTAIL
jgi:hypothetical protein